MRTPFVLLRCICQALLKFVPGGVVGEIAISVLPELAHDIWDWWSRHDKKDNHLSFA